MSTDVITQVITLTQLGQVISGDAHIKGSYRQVNLRIPNLLYFKS